MKKILKRLHEQMKEEMIGFKISVSMDAYFVISIIAFITLINIYFGNS